MFTNIKPPSDEFSFYDHLALVAVRFHFADALGRVVGHEETVFLDTLGEVVVGARFEVGYGDGVLQLVVLRVVDIQLVGLSLAQHVQLLVEYRQTVDGVRSLERSKRLYICNNGARVSTRSSL